MTTVAYKDGILAADTLISYGTFSNGNVNKIHRVSIPQETGPDNQAMIAMTGVCWAIQPMIEWLEMGASQDDIPHSLLQAAGDFSCIMIESDGTVWEFNNGYFIRCGVEYHAIGSGQQFALGAMAAGVSAPQAVAAAMKHDKATGGDVTILSLDDLTTEVKKAA